MPRRSKSGLLETACSLKGLRPVLRAFYVHRDLPFLLWSYAKSLRVSADERQVFDSVRNHCLFVGYSASGSSLLGSLLDAHPDVVLSHELDALRLIRFGFSRDQLYTLILERDLRFSSDGREHHGYGYRVPNQWQGRFRNLLVIGDKLAGYSTRRLGEQPRMLDKLRKTVGVPLRVIHLVRNPYDNIASLWKMTIGLDLTGTADYYFRLARTNAELKRRLNADEFIELQHEAVIANPREHLRRLCAFLGVEADEGYIADCASVVMPAPRQTRFTVEWDKEMIARIAERMAELDFLRGYQFEGP